MRRVLCLYPAWVIRGPRRALTLRTSTGRRGTTTHMRCLLYPRWCPKRRVSTWSFLKRSGLGKCKGRAGGPCNQCNDSLLIGVVFPALHPFLCATNDWCVCVCVCYKSVVKTEEFLHDTGYQPEASKSLQFEKRIPSISKPAANTHTHRQTQFILYTQLHTESVYEMLIVAQKRMWELAAENVYLQSLPIFASQWITCWRCKEVYLAHSKFMAVFHQASQIQPAISESRALAGARYEPSTFYLY